MKLIIGLGNPGPEYRDTRHNAGFLVIDELIRRKGWGEEREKRSSLGGQTVRYRYALLGDSAAAVKPLTFMNASGSAFAAALKDLGSSVPETLVVLDDVSLPLGRLRLRSGGSSGGQKGLEDILNVSGTAEVARLRFGVGAEKVPGDLAAFVLARFSEQEKKVLGESLVRAADAVQCWAERGIDETMNRFNGTESQEGKKETT